MTGMTLGATVLALSGGIVGAGPASAGTGGPGGAGSAMGTERASSAVAGRPPVVGPALPLPPLPIVPVGPREVFVGDFETGDFSQWGQCQSKLTNSKCSGVGKGNRTMKIVSGPDQVRQGRFAAQFNVQPGDVPDFGGSERSEVQSNAKGAVVEEGDERWYQWSTKFPADFENPTSDFFIILQWHSAEGSPPLAVNVSKKGTVDIGGDGVKDRPTKTIGKVRPGEWVDYTLHVMFSQDKKKGFVEAWENGKQTVPLTRRATMVDESNYLKQGIYRRGGKEVTILQDGLRVTAPLLDPPGGKAATPIDPRDGITGPTGGTGSR